MSSKESILRELKKRGVALDSQPQEQSAQNKTIDANKRKIVEELARRGVKVPNEEKEPERNVPETNTPSRLAKMPIAGAANAVETMVNIPSSILNLMVPIVSERLNKAIPKDSKWHNNPMLLTELSEDAFINPSYDKTDLITKGVAKVLGEDLKPKTAAEEIAYGAGEFAVPIPGLGVASKGGKIVSKIQIWTNGFINKRSHECPGEGWRKGFVKRKKNG